MNDHDSTAQARTSNVLLSIPVEVSVVVGRSRPKVSELMALGVDEVLTLDTAISDPVELYVGDRLIARGELEETGDEGTARLAVRITSLHPDGQDKA